MTGRMVCAGVVLLVLGLLQVPGAHGQLVTLSAGATGQISPINVYFADGQNTSVIGTSYLPECIVTSSSGPYIWLEKTDGSLRIAERGPFTGVAVVAWDTAAHPTLNTSYSGTYVCKTNTFNSTQVYQINVVQRIIVTQQPSSFLVNDTGEKYSIMADVRGVFPVTVNWTSSATLATQESSLTIFSFLSNDSGIQVGVPFTVNLTAKYTADIPCAGNTLGNGYSLAQPVIDNCNAAAMPSQATTTVTVQASSCDKLDSLGLHVNATTSTQNHRGAKVTLVCTGNHNLTNDIREVECLATGKWTTLPICEVTHCPAQNTSTIERVDRRPVNPAFNISVSCIDGYGSPTLPLNIRCLTGGVWSTPQPVCSPVDECMTGMHNCSQNCNDTTPGFVCTCFGNGSLGCFAAPTIPPAATTAAPPAAATSSVSDMITMRSMSAVTTAATSMSTHGAVTGVTADTPTSSALDTGAIAGIAVGGAILMALIAGLIIYFAKKRDSVRKNVHDGHGSGDDDEIMLRNRGKSPEKSADGGVRAIDTKDLGNLPPTGQSDQDHSNLPPPPPQESAEGEYDAIVRTEHGKVQLSGNDGQDTYDHITLPNSAAAARPPSPTVAITTMAFTSVTVESVETTNDRANMQPINPDVNYSFVDPTKKRRE